jgi:hypothetical protein
LRFHPVLHKPPVNGEAQPWHTSHAAHILHGSGPRLQRLRAPTASQPPSTAAAAGAVAAAAHDGGGGLRYHPGQAGGAEGCAGEGPRAVPSASLCARASKRQRATACAACGTAAPPRGR